MNEHSPPVVMVISGLDPTGSAGLIADVRVLCALGCHPCGVVTCETVQDSRGLRRIITADSKLLHDQLKLLVDDTPPRAVKIGAISSPDTASVLKHVLDEIPRVPVVMDPVLSPTSGPVFLEREEFLGIARELLGVAYIATPNLSELGAILNLQIDPMDNDEILKGAVSWIQTGLDAVLVTGINRDDYLIDRLYTLRPDSGIDATDFAHEVHDVGEVHGTGCVLSSALSAYLAKGRKITDAADNASRFTSEVISRSVKYGRGSGFWVR